MPTELRRCGIMMEAQVTKKPCIGASCPLSIQCCLPGSVKAHFSSRDFMRLEIFIRKTSSAQKTRGKKATPFPPSGIRQAAGCSPQIHSSRISQTISKCQVEE